MFQADTIIDFLELVNLYQLSDDEGFKDTQLGKHVQVNEEYFPDIEAADMVLVGCGETRGAMTDEDNMIAPDLVRKQFYSLFHWHADVQVADVGNVMSLP